MLYLHIICAGDLNPLPPGVNVGKDGYEISRDYYIGYHLFLQVSQHFLPRLQMSLYLSQYRCQQLKFLGMALFLCITCLRITNHKA